MTAGWRRASLLGFALTVYVPLLLTHPGMIGADTKAYLYLDPNRLLGRAASLWDPNVGLGTVTHQNIGYLLPMGPWYAGFHAAGVPMWVAERLWTGTLVFSAGCGVLYLLRALGWRPPATGVAALSYAFTPYLLEYEARISAILMPWAAMPWMLALTIRAVRSGRWREPALFALVVTLVGGVNASSLIFAGIAPVLWLPFAVWGLREAGAGQAAAAGLRIGALTALTALWWITGLLVQGRYGLDVLRYTETVEVVARTGVATEALRGLGNWYFYGLDAIGPWVQPAADFTQWAWLVGVSLAVPVVAFAAGAIARFRERLFFVGLLVIGVVLVVGVHPYARPSPLGALMKSFAGGSSAGLALRSTGRAAPLIALGSGVLIGAVVHASWERRPAFGAVAAVGLTALAFADMTPLFIGQFVDDNLQRPESIPAYWTAAAAYLSAHGSATRVLQLPGQDFSHFTWGATLDPPLPGLTDRPTVSRELVPAGGAAAADLLRALDRRLQEGVLDPAAIAPIARLMGVGDILLASDLQWERFSTPRPRPTWAQFSPAPPGLTQLAAFGPRVADGPDAAPLDERSLGLPITAPSPPSLAVFGVTDPTPILRAEAGRPIILAGDGEGIVDAAAAGLLTSGAPIFYAGALDARRGDYSAPLTPGATLVLTDSNRRRGQRWGTVRNTYGYTEVVGETPLVADPSNAPLDVFPGAGPEAQTVAVEDGVADVRASGYGNTVTYTPFQRPDLALDGDPGTAWIVGAFAPEVRGQRLEVDLAAPVTAGVITLHQPYSTGTPVPPGAPKPVAPVDEPGSRMITSVRLHFDSGPDVVATLGRQSRTAAGQAVTFPMRTFTTVQVIIEGTSTPPPGVKPADNGVGFSEIGIGTHPPVVDEVERLPTDLLDHAGASSLAHPLDIVLARDRSDPAQPILSDNEPDMARMFTLPTARDFLVRGTARVSALAPDPVIDPLLGRPSAPLSANSSGRLPGDLAARSSAALDGDPTTAWSPARGDQQVGSWIRITVPHPVGLDRFTMQIVTDGRHSVPTRLRFSVDDAPDRTVELPPLGDLPTPGAVSSVPISLPGVTARDHVLVTIDAVRPETSPDIISGKGVELPVALAELGLPGVVEPAPLASVPAVCRTDLLTIDGRSVGVAISGSTAVAAARGALSVSLCGAPVHLGPGTHVLRTAPGRATGIDLDVLVLSSAAGGRSAAASGFGAGTSRSLTVLRQTRTSATVRIAATPAGGPVWVVLGESLNAGWTARADGRSLGAPRLIDGYATGWMVDTPPGRTVTVAMQWTPQHLVWAGLALSGAGVIVCLALAFAPGKRRGSAAAPPDHPVTFAAPWVRRRDTHSLPRVVLVTAGAAALAAVVVAPWAAPIVAVLALAAMAWERGRLVTLAAAVGGVTAACAWEVAAQVRHHYPLILEWPQHFETEGKVALVAVVILGVDAVIDRIMT